MKYLIQIIDARDAQIVIDFLADTIEEAKKIEQQLLQRLSNRYITDIEEIEGN
jgi:hypothetical protein